MIMFTMQEPRRKPWEMRLARWLLRRAVYRVRMSRGYWTGELFDLRTMGEHAIEDRESRERADGTRQREIEAAFRAQALRRGDED